MESIKLKRKYIIIMVLTLIVSVATLTLAYFQGTVINDTINPTTVSTGNLDIKISDASVEATGVNPMYSNNNTNFESASFVKHFSVENGNNDNTLNVCTELYLKVNSIDSGLANSYFRYAVVNDETGTTITGNFNGASNGSNIDLGSLYFFEKGTIKKYTMYIWIEYDSNTNQASMLNKSMNATLYVKAQDTKTKDSCDNRKNFKLTYVTYGDDGCNNVTLAKGEGVTLCSPTRTGEEFKGWYTDNKYTNQVTSITSMSDDVKLYAKWNCVFDGNLTQGATYTNGNYTYYYMQQISYLNDTEISTFFYVPDKRDFRLTDITREGWGVAQTGVLAINTTTDSVSSHVCSYINNKPVVSTSYMFGRSNANSIDLTNFNTSTVVNMRGMFFNSKASSLYLNNFDTSNVVDTGWMFASSKATKLDVSSFDTSNVTNMSYMFSYAKAPSIDLSNFNTSKVTNMEGMFSGNYATKLDVSTFNTSNVTNMKSMFRTSSATSINGLENLNTSNVTDMDSMFASSNVSTLNLSNFVIGDNTILTGMFSGAKATTGYAKDETTANKFNNSSVTSIPNTLKFTVK